MYSRRHMTTPRAEHVLSRADTCYHVTDTYGLFHTSWSSWALHNIRIAVQEHLYYSTRWSGVYYRIIFSLSLIELIHVPIKFRTWWISVPDLKLRQSDTWHIESYCAAMHYITVQIALIANRFYVLITDVISAYYIVQEISLIKRYLIYYLSENMIISYISLSWWDKEVCVYHCHS